MSTSEKKYTPAEAARIMNVAEQTLARWRMLGLGPRYYKIGRKITYYESDINAYIATCARGGVATAAEPAAA